MKVGSSPTASTCPRDSSSSSSFTSSAGKLRSERTSLTSLPFSDAAPTTATRKRPLHGSPDFPVRFIRSKCLAFSLTDGRLPGDVTFLAARRFHGRRGLVAATNLKCQPRKDAGEQVHQR